ncbi:hypothetical protein ACT3UQ_07355 [Glutamicibacter sp. AOP12-B1-11]
MAQQISCTNFASGDISISHGDVEASSRGHEAESVVRQSRTILASPPAATGSSPRGAKRPQELALRGAVVLGLALFGMTACTAQPTETLRSQQAQAEASQAEQQRALIPPTTASGTAEMEATKAPAKQTPAPQDAAEQLEPSTVPTEEPVFEPSEPYEHSAVAYEAKGDGLATITREGKEVSADQMVPVSEKPSKGTGTYSDRLEVSVDLKDQGKVQSEGPGYFTGAPYALFTVTVSNHAEQELDISQVLITAVTAEGDIAQPLYGEVEAYDFSGVLAAGESKKTDYAFMIPQNAKSLQLHIDLDATHVPMIFSATLDKK